MVKKLKDTAIFGGKDYYRVSTYYKNKADAQKIAKNTRKRGENIVLDKNSHGHFLWYGEESKTKSKPKAKAKPKKISVGQIDKELRFPDISPSRRRFLLKERKQIIKSWEK